MTQAYRPAQDVDGSWTVEHCDGRAIPAFRFYDDGDVAADLARALNIAAWDRIHHRDIRDEEEA